MHQNKIILITLILGVSANFSFSNKSFENKQQKVKVSSKITFEKSFITENSLKSNISKDASVMVKLNYQSEVIDFNNIEESKIEQYRNEMFLKQKLFHQQKNLKLMENINTDNFDNLYISSYSPFFTFSYDSKHLISSNVLNNLALNDNISQIVVYGETEHKSNLEMAKRFTGVYPTISSKELTGNGVVVGVLEPGTIDKTHSNLANTNLLVKNGTVTEHATMMGSIIAGTYGIAPKTKLLSVELSGNAVSEIDWLLDNGVNLINCSYGDANPTGKYDSDSAYIDYIVNQYKVTVVCSTGNTGTTNGYVANPALAYNAISIGASSNTNYLPRNFSSYIVETGPQKPNLIAPGYGMNIQPFGINEGTSISAAFTTGCIALLMEKMETLKYHPELVRALLSANANSINSFESKNQLNDKTGAGGLNFSTALNGFSNMLLRTNISNKPNSKLSSFIVDLQKDQKVKAALSWLAKANGNKSNTDLSEYDIVILDSSNSIVAQTTHTLDNIDLIEYTATSTGKYEICIYQRNKFVGIDSIALAYRIL